MTAQAHNEFESLMREALAEARIAQAGGEAPIGACVAGGGVTLAGGYTRRGAAADRTGHAEMLAIRAAAAAVGDWRLTGCTLAVTLEPCCMCAGAIVLARLDRLIYGAADPKAGAVETLYNICTDERLNHRVEVVGGVLADQCAALLSDFFARQRAAGKK